MGGKRKVFPHSAREVVKITYTWLVSIGLLVASDVGAAINPGQSITEQLDIVNVLYVDQKIDEQFQKAGEALARGDYVGAVKIWLPLANANFAPAQYNIGLMYDRGTGLPQDDRQALYWVHKSADQKFPQAQFLLGLMYVLGKAGEKDDARAFQLISDAAREGVPRAQHMLGNMYLYGHLTPQNLTLGAEWIAKAANQGLDAAQHDLGQIYFTGNGVRQNYETAFKWESQAAQQKFALAEYQLAYMYGKGLGVAPNIEKAFEWASMAAQHGNLDAIESLGKLFTRGHGTPRNIAAGALFFGLAAKAERPQAAKNLIIVNEALNESSIQKNQRIVAGWHVGTPLPVEAIDLLTIKNTPAMRGPTSDKLSK